MNQPKTIMDVKILGEYGFDEAMLAIAMNKKKYDRDMYPVSKKLAAAGPGHCKFLEFIHLYIDYRTTRSIHQQIDTYRVGVTKSSESTHHMLIEDVLESCVDRNFITEEFKRIGYIVKPEKCLDGLVPINNTSLLIVQIKTIYDGMPVDPSDIEVKQTDLKVYALVKEYADKYLNTTDTALPMNESTAKVFAQILLQSFKIDYDKYYSMFEGRAEAITKDTVDKMVDLAMTLEDDKYGKLHKLKRMLPEGFLQRRIMSCNYMVLRQMLTQRLTDPFDAWRMFCREILLQVKHPEYFQDILDKYHMTIEDLKNNIWNGKPYIIGY